jgi:UDPglucose 6-dehydrogenase
MAHDIAIIGSGYVGTVAAACFAHVGHNVTAVEVNQAKLDALRSGRAPFYEPGLDQMLTDTMERGTLTFTEDIALALNRSTTLFVCVGTPSGGDGHPDLTAVKAVAHAIGEHLTTYHVIVNKSTVPVGTGKWIASLIEGHLPAEKAGKLVSVVSNPEFLREGRSIHDFLYPDRIVIGSDDEAALDLLSDIYRPITERTFSAAEQLQDPIPLVRTSLTTAEMTKYASNAFLATKISFANEIARVCDLVGADVTEVTAGMGLDNRIGSAFLDAGLGWGGSCFPKDILALIRTASEYGYSPRILRAALDVNSDQRKVVLDALLRHLKTLRGARIGVLGLAFKPGTDDVRDSAALDVVQSLQAREATVICYDPMVAELTGVETVSEPYAVANRADAIVLATEWPEFFNLDMTQLAARMRGDLIFDGRNFFNPDTVRAAGLTYVGIGRSGYSNRALRAAPAPSPEPTN